MYGKQWVTRPCTREPRPNGKLMARPRLGVGRPERRVRGEMQSSRRVRSMATNSRQRTLGMIIRADPQTA